MLDPLFSTVKLGNDFSLNEERELNLNFISKSSIYTSNFSLSLKYLFFILSATLTKAIITGTSTSGPITAVKASPELIPNTPTATAIASSKLLLPAVKERDVATG